MRQAWAVWLGMVVACIVPMPSQADDLPVVYRGPGAPTAEFDSPQTVRVLPGSSMIEITGSFSAALLENFTVVLARAPQVRTVRLDSPGGLIQPAMAIAHLIQVRGLDTYVGRFCASACTLAFLGGHRRFMRANARLGFHQAHAPNQPPERADPMLRQAYSQSGVPAAFIDHVLHTPPEALWFPTPTELHDAGIVTGEPPQDLLLQDSEALNWPETIKQLRWASGGALLRFATAWLDVLQQLQQADPQLCWDYLHHMPVDLGAHVKPDAMKATSAALRQVRDDVEHAPAIGIDAAEQARVMQELIASLPFPIQGDTVAALGPDGDHAGFCPAVQTLLRVAVGLPPVNRDKALRAILANR